MKHGYGNLGAVPVLGTIEVWVQSGYRCMCTPGIPHFFQKKKFQVRVGYGLGTGWVRGRLKVAKNDVVFRKKYSTLSLSLYHPPSAATLTSSAYRRRCTVSSDLDLRRRKISSVLRFSASFSFYWASFSLSVGLEGWSSLLSLPFFSSSDCIFFSLFTFHSSNSFNMWSWFSSSLSQPPTSK